MANKHTTKKALLMSVISLLLCCSMLIGTTFAWFTDEVKSGVNQILAGNLDVEVYNSLTVGENKVGSSTMLFDEITYWEPGVVAYENLTVANLGTLALKYQLSVNFDKATTNANGDTLAKVLKVGFVEGGIQSTTREGALTEVNKWLPLESFVQSGKLDSVAQDLTAAKTSDSYGIVIWWEPSSIDNEFNMNNENKGKIMSIELGIKLVATQLTAEDDSFGPDYDAGAPWLSLADTSWYDPADPQTEYTLYTPEELAGLALLVNGNGAKSASSAVSFQGVTIKLGSDIDLNNQPWTPIGNGANGFHGTFDGNGHTVYNLNVSADTSAGLFGYALNGGNVKNLNIENAFVTANDYAGAVMGRGYTDIDNCHVKNVTVITTPYLTGEGIYDGGAKAGGVIGQVLEGSGNTVTNCSATNVKIYGFRDIGGVAGMIHNNNSASGNTATNVTLGYILFDQITADKNENAGAIYGRVQASATVSPAKDSAENQDYTLVYVVYDAISLKSLANAVNQYSNYERPFEGETVLLLNDVDLGGMEWTPIGDYRFSANRFCGTFDGQGHTISNFKITKKTDKNDANKSSYGFFGNMEGTVKNLTVANASVSSYAYCGALVGRLNSGTLENCHVVNSNVAPSYWQGGIMVGQVNGNVTVKNCTVTGSTITGKSALGGMFGPTTADKSDMLFENCTVKDSAVVQHGSFGGSYDELFGGMFGYIEGGDNRVDVNNCTVVNTTVKGELSSVLSNDTDGSSVYFDGVLYIPPKVIEYDSSTMGSLFDTIANMNSGDTVVLPGGTYNTSGSFQVPAGVTIRGKDGETVVFHQLSAAQDDLFNCAGDVTFENVTFESNRKGYAITYKNQDHTIDGDITVINCKFVGLSADKNWGIYKNINGNLTVKNCTFENYHNAICGVNNGNGSTTVITGCTFTNINGEAIGYVSSSVPVEFEQDAIANNSGLTAENVIGY